MAACPPPRIDPKVYLANERTFLTWMRQAVLVGGIGAAVSGLAAYQGVHMPRRLETPGDVRRLFLLKAVASVLMPLGAAIAVTAGLNFVKRGNMIRRGTPSDDPRWDSRWLPRVLTAVMTCVFAAVMAAAVIRVVSK